MSPDCLRKTHTVDAEVSIMKINEGDMAMPEGAEEAEFDSCFFLRFFSVKHHQGPPEAEMNVRRHGAFPSFRPINVRPALRN